MKAKILSGTAIFVFTVLIAVSCNTKSKLLPEARGKHGEVAVVINRSLWQGACGDSIRNYLAYPIMTLPQAEPMFTLIQQDVLSDLMKQLRNILIVNIDPGYENATLTYKANVWANNQLVFNVNAPSADSVIACIDRNKDIIVSRILVKSRDNNIEYYRRIVNPPVVKKIQDKFQVDICIPKEYSLDVDKDDFMWMSREEGDLTMGILMWKEPYTSKEQLDPYRLISKMNEMTKKYVPGPDPGSYMTHESMVPPMVRVFEKDENYYVQVNGLWQMEAGFMGGPYVNTSMVDAKRGQIVTGVGFVFFPRKEKRDYVRQLEAILYTMTPMKENGNTTEKK